MGWPSTLSYRQVVETGIARSLRVLAAYGDVDTATALLATTPSLADDPEALGEAAENGHDSIVRLMLRYQPRLAERVAVVARTKELTEFLFENGMNPNLAFWLGVTPLHRFAQRGEVEKAAVFLHHGDDLHARDEEFCTTPLGYAAAAGKRIMVEFLLRRGAKPALPDDAPWATPLSLARYRGHGEIITMLEEYLETGRVPAYRLPSKESLVQDLIAAYESGSDDAFLRIIDHFSVRRPMTWDRSELSVRVSRLRRFVRERLGALPYTDVPGSLDISDAQPVIARSYGFESWRELESQAEL